MIRSAKQRRFLQATEAARGYEERSSYAPATDPVAVILLTVECSPGQIEHVLEFLAQVRDRAGVYSVDFEQDLRIPEVDVPEPPKVDETFDYVTAPSITVVTTSDETLVVKTDENEGEVHGEQAIQQPSDDGEAAEVRPGSADVDGSGEPEPVRDGIASVVAEPAGEAGAGSIERSA
jgi:hypothetical protein